MRMKNQAFCQYRPTATQFARLSLQRRGDTWRLTLNRLNIIIIIHIIIIYLLNKHMSKNSSGNNEQDRKAQSALTTARKEFKYRYNHAKTVNTQL